MLVHTRRYHTSLLHSWHNVDQEPFAVPTLIKTKLDVGSTAARWFERFLVLFAYQSMDRPASATVTPAATAVLPAPLTVGVGTDWVLDVGAPVAVNVGVVALATADLTPCFSASLFKVSTKEVPPLPLSTYVFKSAAPLSAAV